MTEYPERTWDFNRRYEISGPWSDEPDKVQWVDQATGLDCLAVRNRMGVWCGYVGITSEHPWFEVGYSQCIEHCEGSVDNGYCEHTPEALISVHGGLTFSDRCHEGVGDEAVCHVPYPGRDGRVWWFGFDCNHAFDLAPSILHPKEFPILENDVYRDLPYVREEVALLAKQLASVGRGLVPVPVSET